MMNQNNKEEKVTLPRTWGPCYLGCTPDAFPFFWHHIGVLACHFPSISYLEEIYSFLVILSNLST